MGSAAGGWAGREGLAKPIIAPHAFGRTQTARPLQPVLGEPYPRTCSRELISAGSEMPLAFTILFLMNSRFSWFK